MTDAAKKPLTVRMHLPAGDDSGPVYAWSEQVADLAVARLPEGPYSAVLPPDISGLPGIVVAMDEDDRPVLSAHSVLAKSHVLRECAIICSAVPVFARPPASDWWQSGPYLAALQSNLSRLLGGCEIHYRGPAEKTRDESPVHQAANDAPALYEMLKIVFGREMKPWLDSLKPEPPEASDGIGYL